MSLIPRVLAVVVLVLPSAALLAANSWDNYAPNTNYQSAWACNGTERFLWYCEEDRQDEAKSNPARPKSKEDQAVEELNRIRKELDAKRALAVVNPTPDNVKAYMAAQKVEIERADLFADVWRRVLWQNAELNFELKHPMNNSAIRVADKSRDERQVKTMTELAREWGIFFFFRGDCAYCKHMIPTLQWLTRQYDMTILPISLDGGSIEGLPPSVPDNGLSRQLGVEVVPLFVLGNVKTHKMVIIGSGVLSLQDFVDRIYVLTQTKPGETL